MKVKGWNNGSPRPSGAGYGIRISKADRDACFKKTWTHVEIEIPGAGTISATLSPSFWRECCEIRNKHIGQWLIRKTLVPWRKNSVPAVHLTHLASNRFRLHV